MMKPKRQKATDNRSLNQVWQRALKYPGSENSIERVKEGVASPQEMVDLPYFSQMSALHPSAKTTRDPCGLAGAAIQPTLFPMLTQPPSLWMERLEDLVMRDGWPVPLTRLYLIHHDRLLFLLDGLRASLNEHANGLPHPLQQYSQATNPLPAKPYGHAPGGRAGQRH